MMYGQGKSDSPIVPAHRAEDLSAHRGWCNNRSVIGTAGGPTMDVFISYASEDASVAEAIERGLQSAGLSVWRDQSRLQGGQEFPAEIDAALRSAKCVLVCLSPAAVGMDWVRAEMKIARARGCLLPVIIATLPDFSCGIEALIGGLQHRDLTAWVEDRAGRGAAWTAMLGDINRFVNGAPPAVPPSPPRPRAEEREGSTVNISTNYGTMRDSIGQQIIKGGTRD